MDHGDEGMTFLAVVPSIWQSSTDECLASMDPALRRNTIVVDNTEQNLGVAASWNVGAYKVIREQLDWLVVLSAGVRFGACGGQDFINALHSDEYGEHLIVEAGEGVGWHAIAFSRCVLRMVGLFDENCWPAYSEDIDWSWRFRVRMNAIEYPGPLWTKVPVDCTVPLVAHGITLASVSVDFVANQEYVAKKWGGYTGEETYVHPFNDPALSWRWWPMPPDPRARQHDGWGMVPRVVCP